MSKIKKLKCADQLEEDWIDMHDKIQELIDAVNELKPTVNVLAISHNLHNNPRPEAEKCSCKTYPPEPKVEKSLDDVITEIVCNREAAKHISDTARTYILKEVEKVIDEWADRIHHHGVSLRTELKSAIKEAISKP